MIVYADILILTNLLTDGLLLVTAVAISGCPPCRFRRIFPAACIGGLASLVILLPQLPIWALILLRIGTAMLMTLTALVPVPVFTYCKITGIYYGMGLILTGILMLSDRFFSPAGLYLHNQAVYINLTFWQLLIAAVGLYFAVRGYLFLRDQGGREEQTGTLTLTYQGRKARLKGLSDSGNLLKDPNSGRSVAVCTLSGLLPLFDSEAQKNLAEQREPSALFAALSAAHVQAHLIPYSGVDSSGLLTVFLPDQASWRGAGFEDAGDWAVGILPAGKQLADGFEAVLHLPQRGGAS